MLLIILCGVTFCSELCLCKWVYNIAIQIDIYLSTREKTSSSVPRTTDSFLLPVKKISPQELQWLSASAQETPAIHGWVSIFLKPFSACRLPAGTSSSSTESSYHWQCRPLAPPLSKDKQGGLPAAQAPRPTEWLQNNHIEKVQRVPFWYCYKEFCLI